MKTVWKCGECGGTYFNTLKELRSHLDGQLCGVKPGKIIEEEQYLVRIFRGKET